MSAGEPAPSAGEATLPPVDVEAEQAEDVTLQRVRYEAHEQDAHEDPDAHLACLEGPWDGEPVGPVACGCKRECGCTTWPVRWRPPEEPEGEYVLAYVWCEEGAELAGGGA
jgi:hypothetical protein